MCAYYECDCFKCPLDETAICDTELTIFTEIDDEALKLSEEIIKAHYEEVNK